MSFDSSELTIGAGAASGTIKIWDVEEAKGMTSIDAWCILHWKHKLQLCYAIISVLIEYCAQCAVVRTFTGHRSNCASLDFHPFGEFLASGSSDTNMKIWDIRKKRCIHTYKGHTRRIDVLKFTPDGRWIVSGGADNSVKVKIVSMYIKYNAKLSKIIAPKIQGVLTAWLLSTRWTISYYY